MSTSDHNFASLAGFGQFGLEVCELLYYKAEIMHMINDMEISNINSVGATGVRVLHQVIEMRRMETKFRVYKYDSISLDEMQPWYFSCLLVLIPACMLSSKRIAESRCWGVIGRRSESQFRITHRAGCNRQKTYHCISNLGLRCIIE